MGHVANYAELSILMTPRPFMVERGHDDGVGIDEWVAWEFAKVRRHYNKLGIGHLTEIEFFDGPHTINGDAIPLSASASSMAGTGKLEVKGIPGTTISVEV